MKKTLKSLAAAVVALLSLPILTVAVGGFIVGLFNLFKGAAVGPETPDLDLRAALGFAAAAAATAVLALLWRLGGLAVEFFSARRAVLLCGIFDWVLLAFWTAMWCYIWPRHPNKWLLTGYLLMALLVLVAGFIAMVRARSVRGFQNE